MQQGFNIKGRTSHGNYGFFPGEDRVDGLVGQVEETIHAERIGWLDDIDEVVGNPPAFFGGGFGGADIHSPIDFHRVNADDLAAEGLR